MSFPSKQEREKCWLSRDEFWKCLDDNPSSQDNPAAGSQLSDKCAKFREIYESACPSQWVKHFDRKREYLKFKDRIQREGYEPLNELPKPIKSNPTDDKPNDKQDNQSSSKSTS